MADWWNPAPTVGETVADAVRSYVHRSATLAADVLEGRAIALGAVNTWTPRTWRGWLASSAALTAELTGGIATPGGTALTARVDLSGSDWRADAARLFQRTAEILADSAAEPGDAVPENPATENGDTGNPWVVAVVAIVVVGGTAAVGWLGYQAIQVIDRQLARNAAARELVRTDEITERMVDAHLERERAAGKPLPLDEGTKAALETLRARQLAAAPHAPPLAAPGGSALAGLGWGMSGGLLIAAAVALALVAPSLLKG